jgi:hypothetical protein
MCDRILIEIPKVNQSQVENIFLHIKNLMDSTPLLNLLIEEEESKSIDNEDDPMCPFERQFVEYVDKSFQTDAITPTSEKVEILTKHSLIEVQQLIVPVESITQQLTPQVEVEPTSQSISLIN